MRVDVDCGGRWLKITSMRKTSETLIEMVEKLKVSNEEIFPNLVEIVKEN